MEQKQWSNKEINEYLENNEEIHDTLMEMLLDQGGDEKAVIGFSDREQQANYYFHEKMNALDSGDYPETVNMIRDLYEFISKYCNDENIDKLCEDLKANGYDICSLIWTDNYNGNEYFFYSDVEEAEADFEQLKDSKEPYISDLVNEFEEDIKDACNFTILVEVKMEYGYPFYSYNIYDNDIMITDGAYDLREEQKEEVKNYIELLKYLKEKNLYLDSIDKNIDGFTRYYAITIGMYGKYETIEVEVPMDGKATLKGYNQGVERSLVNVFKDFVDIDDLLQQFEELD